MKSLIDILEIPLILERIQTNTRTSLASKWILNSEFIPAIDLKEKSIEVEEMMNLKLRFGRLPIDQSHDLTTLIGLIEKGSIITIEGLVSIQLDLQTITLIFKFANSIKPDFPNLAKLWKQLVIPLQVKTLVDRIVSPQGGIRDDASENLLRIRQRLSRINAQMLTTIQSMVNRYESYLNEPLFTLKNGHYVLPVTTSNKSFVPGMIHDVSSTGLTTFIEPKPLVDLTLEKQLLHGEEQEEIVTILKEATAGIFPELSVIRSNNHLIGYLDCIAAKAQFGLDHKGFIAQLVDEPMIELTLARHPLIDATRVVANDFLLTEKQSIVIISGPNAGGKTVAMKTVGLFVYLHQLAIPLPTAKPARISYFKKIYADIGDQQSVLENLSTFAGHIRQLVPLTDLVKPNDLVLIDELGTGTDPKEGESLARSLLIHLQAKRAFVIVSSHFPGLKTLALEEPRMVNASLQFDELSLSPTYRFILGLPGKSYGLIMAKRYGLAPQVVAHAEKYLADQLAGKDQQTLIKLQHELQEVERLKAAIILEQKQIQNQQKELTQKLKIIEKKEQDFAIQTTKKQDDLILETKQKVETVIKALANPQLKLHEAIALKKELEFSPSEADASDENTVEISHGDYVIERTTGMVGRVEAINKKQIMMITQDGLTLKVKQDQVEKTSPPLLKKASSNFSRHSLVKSKKISSSLNIIGMRYEEASLALDQYYDACMVSQLKTFKIIHGFGSGVLRKMVHTFFEKRPEVKLIQQGEGEQAGYGVTVIHLK